MGRRKVMNPAQEEFLRSHIPSWIVHQDNSSLDEKFYPPLYEEFFSKFPVPPVTEKDLNEAGGDLVEAKKAKYLAARTVSHSLTQMAKHLLTVR